MRQKDATDEFKRQLSATATIPAERGGMVMRAVASRIGQEVIAGGEFSPGTPVDTGFARGSWYATTDAAPDGHPAPPIKDHSGAAAGAQMAAALDGVQQSAATLELGDVWSLVNDAEYIEMLNNGHSQQAPTGMTDGIVASFEPLVAQEVARLGIKDGQ